MHTTPHLNYTPITSPLTHNLQLSNLDVLNAWGRHVFLTSNDDPTDPPSWLRGDHNVPAGSSRDCHGDGDGGGDGDGDMGLSSAPAIIIWTEKPHGIVDVFYFYFYSFNLGNTVAGWRFGNHVGDWGVLLTSAPPPSPPQPRVRADEFDGRTHHGEVCRWTARQDVLQRAQRRVGLPLCRRREDWATGS